MAYDAVIFDLGGVVLGSPLHAIRDFEAETGMPPMAIARVVASGGEQGAWQRHERGEIDYGTFCRAFEAEGEANGTPFSATELMRRIDAAARPRPSMVRAVARIREAGVKAAALTNNWAGPAPAAEAFHVLQGYFDVFVESHVEGMRKPDPRIYRLVLERLGTRPWQTVFLDDIGRNLKPAREMGIRTIKVDDPAAALLELGELLGIDLSS